MSRLATLFGLLGLAAVTCIVIWSGYASILQALQVAGWGILWTALFHLIPLFSSSYGWQALMPGRKRPTAFFVFFVMWLRGSVNNLMPVARIGGEVVSVRVMMKHGIRKSTAIASTIVELTLSIAAEFVFVLLGIFFLSLRISDNNLGWKLVAGLVATTPALAALAVIQRVGFFGVLDKIFTFALSDTWTKFAGNIAQMDRAIHRMYRRTGRLALCFVLVFLSWSGCSIELWIGLHYLGHPLGFIDCFILEALLQGAVSAAFAVPGALGVQEAGFVFFGHLLGLAPDIAMALAVIRRCRDLLIYVPGLIMWQVEEGKWLLKR